MNIEINKNNRIVCVCYAGGTEKGFDVDDFDFSGDIFDYVYTNNSFIFSPIENKNEFFIKKEYNEDLDLYIDVSTLKEKQDFYKNRMIEINNQIKELNEIGLGGGADEIKLRAELEEYRTQYMNSVHEEALEADKALSTPTTLEEE